MHVILHILVDVPPDERFNSQQIRQYTRDEVEAALGRASTDIGTILSVEVDSPSASEGDDPPVVQSNTKGGP